MTLLLVSFRNYYEFRRQETGGNPEAYSSQLIMDDRQFGKLAYSGEGSKVITVPNINACSYTI